MKEATFKYPEAKNYNDVKETAREDIAALKKDATELGKHLHEEGKRQVMEAKDYVVDRLSQLQDVGRHQMEVIEDRVKHKPGQTLAFAFAAGILASYLFGRR